jgi:hypothetical protein
MCWVWRRVRLSQHLSGVLALRLTTSASRALWLETIAVLGDDPVVERPAMAA